MISFSKSGGPKFWGQCFRVLNEFHFVEFLELCCTAGFLPFRGPCGVQGQKSLKQLRNICSKMFGCEGSTGTHTVWVAYSCNKLELKTSVFIAFSPQVHFVATNAHHPFLLPPPPPQLPVHLRQRKKCLFVSLPKLFHQ